MAEPYRPVAPVDPTNLRPMMFLDVARAMMLNQDWSHRAVSVVMESHTGPGRFAFYGANHPDVILDVHERRVDISILNPAALLTMAQRGTSAFSSPRDVGSRRHALPGFHSMPCSASQLRSCAGRSPGAVGRPCTGPGWRPSVPPTCMAHSSPRSSTIFSNAGGRRSSSRLLHRVHDHSSAPGSSVFVRVIS
jgi:hypothetical protein